VNVPAARPYLTTHAVRSFVRENCFAPANGGRVGVEWESLTFFTGQPSLRPSAGELLAALTDVDLPAGGSVTFEPGGQVELSSPPLAGVGAAVSATARDLTVLSHALGEAGLQLVARGFDPLRPPLRI